MQPVENYSICALYCSKNHVGLSYFDQDALKIDCSAIYALNYKAKKFIFKFLKSKNLSSILTNNPKHELFNNSFREEFKIITVNEKCLQDDVIQNNLHELRINAANNKIKSKISYIEKMKDEGEAFSSFKEKFRSLGMILFHLLNQFQVNVRAKLFLDDIYYFTDNLLQHVVVGKHEQEFLEITKEELHPSLIKGKGRSKEGISFYSLYESSLFTSGGKKIMQNIFLNPTFDKATLQKRYSLIQWMKINLGEEDIAKMFRNIHNVDSILKRFNRMQVEPEDWVKLIRSIENCTIFHQIVNERVMKNGQVPLLLNEILDEIQWEPISQILSAVSSTLELTPFSIKKTVDTKLDELKKTYDNMPQLLTLYARQQKWEFDFRIVFMAQIGYLVRIPYDEEMPEIVEKESWQQQFTNNSGRYYSNKLTEILDQDYGDIYGEIIDREKKIIFQLEALVIEYTLALEKMYWAICELQCFWNVSQISKHMCRPKLSEEGLIVSNGWHLLLGQKAVSNNCFSYNHERGPSEKVQNDEKNFVNTKYANRIMLITGPNASGKSVYIKQMASIIYLAHLGFFVPAQFAEIPLIDKIFFIREAISRYKNENGFKSELASLSKIMVPGYLTNKSIVLIDELGCQVDIKLGIKIFKATVKYLSNNTQQHFKENEILSKPLNKFKIPLCLAVTHFTSLMIERIIGQNEMIRFLRAEMTAKMVRLFKIKPGVSGGKYGIQCAGEILSSEIIEMSQKIYNNLSQIK